MGATVALCETVGRRLGEGVGVADQEGEVDGEDVRGVNVRTRVVVCEWVKV